MNTRPSLLKLSELQVSYGPTQVLHGIDLEVGLGEIVALIGSNGAGKTTLLKSLFGMPKPKSGHIRFKDLDLTRIPTHKLSRAGLSLVPEGRHIFAGMTVLENLLMGLCAERLPKNEVAQELDKIYAMFPRLSERRQQRAGTLSGGEQQMLAIGRALMAKPELLLLDEPSLGLAPLIVKNIFETLKQVAQLGMTIFLVEQNAHQALSLADRAYVLANGRVVMTGRGKDLLANKEVQQAYLGAH